MRLAGGTETESVFVTERVRCSQSILALFRQTENPRSKKEMEMWEGPRDDAPVGYCRLNRIKSIAIAVARSTTVVPQRIHSSLENTAPSSFRRADVFGEVDHTTDFQVIIEPTESFDLIINFT